MKRLACVLLTGALFIGAASSVAQASPEADSEPAFGDLGQTIYFKSQSDSLFELAQRPAAQTVWSITVKYRTRRSPQFPWGPWRTYTTIYAYDPPMGRRQFGYNEAQALARRVSETIADISRNCQAKTEPATRVR